MQQTLILSLYYAEYSFSVVHVYKTQCIHFKLPVLYRIARHQPVADKRTELTETRFGWGLKKYLSATNLLLLYVDEEILASGALLVVSGNGLGMLPMQSDTIKDVNNK